MYLLKHIKGQMCFELLFSISKYFIKEYMDTAHLLQNELSLLYIINIILS